MSKDLNSLIESRLIRESMRQRYGIIPRSILPSQWSLKVKDTFISGYQDHMKKDGQIGTPWGLSGIGGRHGDHSRFPQNIGIFLTKFYTPDKLENDPGYFNNYLATILDPFAGHVSRLDLVYKCNRNYVGWDCSKQFMKYNQIVANELQNNLTLFPSMNKIELVEGDSRTINYDNQFDFCLTSPPYFNLEDYGSEPEQLGKLGSYEDFLNGLQQIINNCYRALKEETFIAWEVNDFRIDKEFIIFHADVINLFRKAGFLIHDIIIVDYLSGFLFKFASQMEEYKFVAKTHSYIIVGRKGDKNKRKFTSRGDLLKIAHDTIPITGIV